MAPADLQQHERGASDLHRGVRPGEDPRTIGKRLGNGRGHQQRQQHGGEQQAADARRLRVEPVADPARVLPAEPDREPQHQRLQYTGQVQVVQQMVAELGDREYVDQIEEQFFVGHAGMVAVAVAKRGQAQSGTHGTPSARQAPVQETGQQRRRGKHQQQDRQLPRTA